MSFSVNSAFPLTTLPYMIQTRFMECLPYFQQIELAQTNQQFFQMYENRCKKRNINDSVNIVVDKNGIYINEEFILFKNEKSIKHYIQGNHFPTQLLTMSNVEKIEECKINILAKELTNNGLYFQNKNQKKYALKWMESTLTHKDYTKFEFGWQRQHESLPIEFLYRGKFRNTLDFSNLSKLFKMSE